jgi:hypothetical protein
MEFAQLLRLDRRDRISGTEVAKPIRMFTEEIFTNEVSGDRGDLLLIGLDSWEL